MLHIIMKAAPVGLRLFCLSRVKYLDRNYLYMAKPLDLYYALGASISWYSLVYMPLAGGKMVLKCFG
jgi:hypothetical protein